MRASLQGRWLHAAMSLAVATLLAPIAAHGRLKLNIGGANFRPFPVAVLAVEPATSAAQPVAEALTALVRADADLTRSLQLVPPNTYLGTEDPWDRPSLAAWRDVGAAGLVTGRLEVQQGTVRVALRFYDVATGRQLVARSCQQEAGRQHACAHRFLDDVVAELTGEQGPFSARIAAVRRDGRHKTLVAFDVDGQAPAALTRGAVLDLLPAWEPGGRALLFTSFRGGNADLYRLPLGGGATAAAAEPSPLSRHPGLNTGAAVSPDGRRVALTLSQGKSTQIFTMRPDGRDLRAVTQSGGQNLSPTWSPDGRRLAFVSSRSGSPQLFVMDADGANLRRLTFRGAYNQEPDWSPRAGGMIAFTARDEHFKYDIFLVDPGSGKITRLTEDEGHNQSPSFSPDGHTLAFTSSRRAGAGTRVWTMDADGGRQREIPLPAGDFETPAWGPRLGYE